MKVKVRSSFKFLTMKYIESIMLDQYQTFCLRQVMSEPLSARVSVSVVRSVITVAAASDTHEGPSHDHAATIWV